MSLRYTKVGKNPSPSSKKPGINKKILDNNFKYLIEMFDIESGMSEPICLYDTEEKAQECIGSKTKYYRIRKVRYYE